MIGSDNSTARMISVIAGTLVALSCGTNYAYSAWAPQFAHRMKLSSTESNLIGAAGNLGMYAMGIPLGLLTDSKGPRLMSLVGSACLVVGYYPIHLSYASGPGSVPVVFLCFFTFLTGTGGCAAFTGAIKTAASNYPNHRGTATAFPLAALGLSAMFWSTISTLIFKEDTGNFLLLLALGTSILCLVSMPFLRIFEVESYTSVSHGDSRRPTESRRMRRPTDASASESFQEPDVHSSRAFLSEHTTHARSHSRSLSASNTRASTQRARGYSNDLNESSSLVSKNSKHEPRSSIDSSDDDFLPDVTVEQSQPDIRGMAMLRTVEFWQLFMTMVLLSGIGLMTINNIGNSAKALWQFYNDRTTPKFIQQRQVMHVSVLSFGNFLGRLSSGIGSDFLVKELELSRFWCLFTSAVIFTLTQLAGASISDPNNLVAVSSFTGLAYGFLFGVFPSLTAHTFGINGLSQNWGVMTLAPVLSSNVFNLLYGAIYDHHSVVGRDGDRQCRQGLSCYRSAYYFTFFSGLAGLGVCMWSIIRERRNQSQGKKPSYRVA
ncbi:hypothetical protein NUU61_008606 [Penicillium alfredii]|uniref:Nodulin-like domain-containing protein n=1 Tax=Penicillium alfredii TaxID=1506179 RepID=A0A9W9ELG8_9EURO|nr:uncharacterized protein NUU61_008606 [Penicillium alfredii]KAJ5084027.1 hypothetical protein NUU61_008606 [Penicillium alfredii]